MTISRVVLHFDKQEDALQFTLAASTVMYADGPLQGEALNRLAKAIRKAERITTEGAVESAESESSPEFAPQCA
jgi:hypothetical protein